MAFLIASTVVFTHLKLAYHDDSHEEDQESVQGEGANSSSSDGEETSGLNTSAAISVVEEPTTPQMFLYYMMHDDGFAPCLDGDLCTLACCKKDIRLHANPGDVIVGLMSQTLGNLCDRAPKSMIWCGTVDRKITMQDYFKEFPRRRDCIYDDNLEYIDNAYHPADDEDNIRKDKEGLYVLIMEDVYRFGDKEIDGSVLLAGKQLSQGYAKHPVMPELREILKQSGGNQLFGTTDEARKQRVYAYYDDDGWTPELQQEIDDRLEKEEQDRQEAKEEEDQYFQSLEKEMRELDLAQEAAEELQAEEEHEINQEIENMERYCVPHSQDNGEPSPKRPAIESVEESETEAEPEDSLSESE